VNCGRQLGSRSHSCRKRDGLRSRRNIFPLPPFFCAGTWGGGRGRSWLEEICLKLESRAPQMQRRYIEARLHDYITSYTSALRLHKLTVQCSVAAFTKI